MLPQKLKLNNFLSYQELDLDFSGIHVACIWGANGAGKSALLEAIAWAIWGYSRASNEDNLIYFGAREVKVDFTFQLNNQQFRIMRRRIRGGNVSLEWQTHYQGQWQSLTAKNVKLTQKAIIDSLKMDYETFINSAYLRQGKADEFMLKGPSDRKQVLAEILQLGLYEQLSEKAKDLARTTKGSILALESQLAHLHQQIQRTQSTMVDLGALEREQTVLETANQQALELLHTQQYATQQLHWLNQERQNLEQAQQHMREQLRLQQQQLHLLSEILRQEPEITAAYRQYQEVSQQVKQLAEKQEKYQNLMHRAQQLEDYIAEQRRELQMYLHGYRTKIAQLQQQQQEMLSVINRAQEIEQGLAQLQQARERLEQLSQLQAQASPLLQRRTQLEMELERQKSKRLAQIEELTKQKQKYSEQIQRLQAIAQQQQLLADKIALLRKKEVYQQRVHAKGLERRQFLERINTRLESCQQKYTALLEQKQALENGAVTVCPTCERPLDREHLAHLLQHIEANLSELQNEMWVLKEQQATSECEIQVLRQEYCELKAELQQLPELLKQSGAWQATLDNLQSAQIALQEIEQQILHLQSQLYHPDTQAELALVNASLAKLNYDDKDLALARADCDRLRWAEIKAAELKNARHQWQSLTAQIADLQLQSHQLEERLAQNHIAPEKQQELEQLRRAIAHLHYDPRQHQQLQQQKDQLTSFLLKYQELQNAQAQYQPLQHQHQQCQYSLHSHEQQLQAIHQQIRHYQQQLQSIPSAHQLQKEIAQRRQRLDQLLAEIAIWQEAQKQLAGMTQQAQAIAQQLEYLRHRQFLAQELQSAFGKNGIPALTIEHLLPQIEAEANRLLAQLSNHQLTLRFITQKASKTNSRVIDTLDIEVADHRGTRPYETYSGGEAFRINFSIRLALARVLTQRQGCTLQTLIIDEGFGSQDREGCHRLLSAINAIAPEFGCILVVTHVPYLKEAFSTVLAVQKTAHGSTVEILT